MANDVAFGVDTVNRDVIFRKSLRSLWAVKLQPIRMTLGLRETGKSTINRPKFVSEDAQDLETAITKVSKEKLPNERFESLQRAWNEGKLLNTEINNLIEEYGKKIWGAPMNQRHIRENHQSHLLVAGEGEGIYNTDLFYDNQGHRAYIKLQLEHMAYAKAIYYYKNHNYTTNTDRRSATRADKTSSAKKVALPKKVTPATEKAYSKAESSLMAVLSLRSTYLLRFPQDSRTRKRSLNDDRPYAPRHRRNEPSGGAAEDHDVEFDNEYALRSRGQIQHSRSTTAASEENENETADEYDSRDRGQNRPKIIGGHVAQGHGAYAQKRRRGSRRPTDVINVGNDDKHTNQHTQKRYRVNETSEESQESWSSRNTIHPAAQRVINETRNGINELYPMHNIGSPHRFTDTDRDTTLSPPPEGLLEDTPERVSIPKDQGIVGSRRENAPQIISNDGPVVESEVQADNQLVDEADSRHEDEADNRRVDEADSRHEGEADNPHEDEIYERRERTISPVLDEEQLRLDLRVLLLGELYDVSGAHQVSKETHELWEASQDINEKLKMLWAIDKVELELQMGAEKFMMVDRVLDEWLVWRDMTRQLGSVVGVHPSEGPLPLLTSEQWMEKLGKREFKAMDMRLATYNSYLRLYRSGANKDDFAKLLATAFSSVIKYRLGVEGFISVYKEDILTFNEKLFLWPLDFAS